MKSLYSISQKSIANQVASKSSTTIIKSKRDVATVKFFKQQRFDSQLQHEVERKAAGKARKVEAAARKMANNIKTREKDIMDIADLIKDSQLIEDFRRFDLKK